MYITCILYIECNILITRGSLAENLNALLGIIVVELNC